MPKKRSVFCGVCGSEREKVGDRLRCIPCSRRRSKTWQKLNRDRTNERNRRYKQRNIEKVKTVSRNSKLKNAYGLTLEEYDLLLLSQGSLCAICRQAEVKRHTNGTLWSLSVDHDHNTGRIRGLLCSACNEGLGKFRDNISFLSAAINYLLEAQE